MGLEQTANSLPLDCNYFTKMTVNYLVEFLESEKEEVSRMYLSGLKMRKTWMVVMHELLLQLFSLVPKILTD